jgi:hypothetical protein
VVAGRLAGAEGRSGGGVVEVDVGGEAAVEEGDLLVYIE